MRITARYGKKADRALSMWVKLARATAIFGQLTGEDIRRYGLTQAQFGALETLGHVGPLTLGELCRKQLVTGGNMTVVVDNLEKEGLVERIHNKEDRRVTRVQLTAKGKKLFDDIFVQHVRCVTELASVLNEREQDDLGKLLKKLGISLQTRL